jgi:RND family efflux transporter MFP subunit
MTGDIYVDEEEINLIEEGMKVVIERENKRHTGKVTNKSVSVDPMRQAFAVEVEFDNSNYELRANLTYQIKVLVYENKETVVVPRNIVQEDKEGNYVFVFKDSKAEKRYITRGEENGLYLEVEKGLNPGDKLITKGSALLEEGQKVKVIQ